MANGTLALKVVTPERTVFTGTVSECRAPGLDGEFGVLPEHIAYLTALVPGVLTFEAGGDTRRFALGRGFAQVADDHVAILAEFAEAADELSQDEVLNTLHSAEEELAKTGPQDVNYEEAMTRVLRARARNAAILR